MAEYEMPIEEHIKILVREFSALNLTIDRRFDGVDARLDRIEMRLDKVDETAKFGLEAVEGLRESMDRKFAAADKKHDEQINLLKSLQVHVRKRVEVLERPKARRGRS